MTILIVFASFIKNMLPITVRLLMGNGSNCLSYSVVIVDARIDTMPFFSNPLLVQSLSPFAILNVDRNSILHLPHSRIVAIPLSLPESDSIPKKI